jgi:hypothetical protein
LMGRSKADSGVVGGAVEEAERAGRTGH